ncbi:MAG TPA: hypothetical protein VM531_12545, partial [Sphingomicrobium sp.]|nr:hypothetical protein [Sphingomicrobium sp.]
MERANNDRDVSQNPLSLHEAIKMKFTKTLATLIAIAGMATPAMADVRTAAYAGGVERGPIQTSVFAGATIRIGLNQQPGEQRYRTSLGINGMARDP